MSDITVRLRERPYRLASETETEAKERRQNDRVEAAAEIDRLRACVSAALNMVDGDGTPPDWDELRAALEAAKKEGK